MRNYVILNAVKDPLSQAQCCISNFILSAARREAEETIIKATPEAYAEFLQRVDKFPMFNARLIKTMQTKAPWDKKRSMKN